MGNINIVQEKLGANIFLEFGIWGTRLITAFLSQKVSNKKLFTMEKKQETLTL